MNGKKCWSKTSRRRKNIISIYNIHFFGLIQFLFWFSREEKRSKEEDGFFSFWISFTGWYSSMCDKFKLFSVVCFCLSIARLFTVCGNQDDQCETEAVSVDEWESLATVSSAEDDRKLPHQIASNILYHMHGVPFQYFNLNHTTSAFASSKIDSLVMRCLIYERTHSTHYLNTQNGV